MNGFFPRLPTLLFALFAVAAARIPAETPRFLWIEGESAETTAPAKRAGWGRPQLLSDGKWLHLSVDADHVEKEVPADGFVLRYPIECPETARFELWDRLGLESVRSDFDWRLDGGAWTNVPSDALSTDLMELDFWCDLGWLKLGDVDLAAGKHQIEIRIPRARDAKGKWKALVHASDALCLTPAQFHPNGKFKPGDPGRTGADEAAARNVFHLPETPPSERSSITLAGTWEIARDDEALPGEVALPIPELPSNPIWRAITVPGDKAREREDLIFAHRVWYRTRVEIPAHLKDRAFHLEFPGNNLNTTVFVNRILCGFEKNPFAPFRVDVTPGIDAGKTNEIWVGIRDAWYGRSADPTRPLKLRRTFNYPPRLFSQGFQDLDYPVWNCPQSGILCTPSLVAAGGPVHVAEAFVQPSVARHELVADLILSNTTDRPAAGEIRWEAIDHSTGKPSISFTPAPFELAPGEEQTLRLSGPWSDPELWWPDSPHLYRLRTTVTIGGKPVDVRETVFGFREWQIAGTKFLLNGVVWHLWADLVGVENSPQAWLEAYKRTDQRTLRMGTAGQASAATRWLGLEPQDALDFCDRNGVVVRRNTTLDGETIGYQFSEPDAETRRQQGGSELKLALMRNWRDQCVAQVRGERHHPSIQIWSLENEFAFINLINLLGNSPNMDRYEAEIAKTHDAVLAADPTRPSMTDGGGAMKNHSLRVAGDHYVATLDARYPDLAYQPFPEGGGRGRWNWDQKRPRFIGEDFFATGINPADYAAWGGEVAFQGKAATRDAVALCYRMLTEGYRWGGHYAAWHLWLGGEGGPSQWIACRPRAVFTRQWDWTFAAGSRQPRTYGIFNDTQYREPIVFQRTLTIAGKEPASRQSTHDIAPGTAEKFDEDIVLPAVGARTEGELVLTLSAGGHEIFRDSKHISLLPAPDIAGIPGDSLTVWDPKGSATRWLKSAGTPFNEVTTLESVPASTRVLVVGSDALDEQASTSTRLAVLASEGRAVVVLDQDHPLKFQAIPAELELAPPTRKSDFGADVPASEGQTAFLEDTSHPALRGLKDKDFFTWGPGRWVYRNAYRKPARGAKSLVQCGPRLELSTLVEVPVGKGVLFLSQLSIGQELTRHAVPRQLLANLIRAGFDYHLDVAEVATSTDDRQLAAAVDAIGLKYQRATDVLSAIRDPARSLAIVSASPAALAQLAGHTNDLQSFWNRGGNIVLCGLTPAGLADFNRIVGVDHVLRPFKRERVTLPAVRHPLTAGLTTGDIVMLSGKRIFGWTADEYVSPDVFSYVVDLEDVAPFAKSDFASYDNIVNGFVGSDGWPLIVDFDVPRDGRPFEIHMDLPHEETLLEYTHDASMNYNATTRIALLFDDRDRVEFELQPNGDPQTFPITPPRRARRVTLQLLSWLGDPAKKPLIGIDNIYLKAQRSLGWKRTVHPMLNVGGLVQYTQGPGSVVLCNLKFQETEAVPANATKKRAILAAVLRNLKAPFSGGPVVLAGGNLDYSPLDIHAKATTYKDERGWPGNKQHNLKSLPPGEHLFAGVRYVVYEMPTSPVPQLIMIAGKNAPPGLPDRIDAIPVNTRTDALFFLHAARLEPRPNNSDTRSRKASELCRYVVHYEDGQSVEVPVIAGIDIDHLIQRSPKSLPGAQLAWTARIDNSEDSAAVYSLQWNNPRPGVTVKSVDLVPGTDRDRGVPALIAITAARAR